MAGWREEQPRRSSARLDGSQGKLRAEKNRVVKRASFAWEKQFAGPVKEAGRNG
jgi:hypothetical protein